MTFFAFLSLNELPSDAFWLTVSIKLTESNSKGIHYIFLCKYNRPKILQFFSFFRLDFHLD